MSGQLPRAGLCRGGCAGGGGGSGGGKNSDNPKAIDATHAEAIGEAHSKAHAATDDCQTYGESYQETNHPVATCPSTAEANNGFGTRTDQ